MNNPNVNKQSTSNNNNSLLVPDPLERNLPFEDPIAAISAEEELLTSSKQVKTNEKIKNLMGDEFFKVHDPNSLQTKVEIFSYKDATTSGSLDNKMSSSTSNSSESNIALKNSLLRENRVNKTINTNTNTNKVSSLSVNTVSYFTKRIENFKSPKQIGVEYKKLLLDLKRLLNSYIINERKEAQRGHSIPFSGITNTIKNVTNFTGSTSPHNTRFGTLIQSSLPGTFVNNSLFGNSNQEEIYPNFLKILNQVKQLLSKIDRNGRKNFPLSIRRQIINFLFIPFNLRYLDVHLCHKTFTLLQFFQLEFPFETPSQLIQLLELYLCALNSPSNIVKELALNNIKFLVNQTLTQDIYKLNYYEYEVMLDSLTCSLGLSGPPNISKEEEIIVEKLTFELIRIITKVGDDLMSELSGKPSPNGLAFYTSLSRSIASPISEVREYAMKLLLEKPWPKYNDFLQIRIFYETFISSAYSILSYLLNSNENTDIYLLCQIIQLLSKHSFPSKEWFTKLGNSNIQIISTCAIIGLSINSPNQNDPNYQEIFDKFCTILRLSRDFLEALIEHGFEEILQLAIKEFINSSELNHKLVFIFRTIIDTNNFKLAENLAFKVIPSLFEIFQNEPNITITEDLNLILSKLKETFPIAFYSPLVSMISCQDVITATNLSSILNFLSKCLTVQEILFVELDLFSVILFTDLGNEMEYSLGQIVFLCHFISAIKQINQYKQLNIIDFEFNKYIQYLSLIENQISIFLTAKDCINNPEPHPIIKQIIIQILLNIRLLINTNKRPGWLNIILKWFKNGHNNSYLEFNFSNLISDLKTISIYLKQSSKLISKTLNSRVSTFSTEILINNINNNNTNLLNNGLFPTDIIRYDNKLINEYINLEYLFSDSSKMEIFNLFNLVHQFILKEEFRSLLELTWNYGIVNGNFNSNSQLLFLFLADGDEDYVINFLMEKLDLFLNSNNTNFYSFNLLFKLLEMNKSNLKSLKNLITNYRVFRNLGTNLKFVSTSIGTFEPVMKESKLLTKLKVSGTSIDEIKTIQSLGWDEEEEEEDTNNYFKSGVYPVLLFSLTFEEIYLDDRSLELHFDDSIYSTNYNLSKPLLSNFSGNLILNLLRDISSHITLFSNLKIQLIFNLMRLNPNWLLRLILNNIDELNEFKLDERLLNINNLILIQTKLPIIFSYHFLNYILGWLRWTYRDKMVKNLYLITQVVPILSRILPSCYEVTFRELRKSKLDSSLFFDGSFFLNEPNNFFRYPKKEFLKDILNSNNLKSFQIIPKPIFDLSLLRIGQANFISNMIIKSPHDAFIIIKLLQKFEPITWLFNNEDNSDDCNNDNNFNMAFYKDERFRSLSSLIIHSWISFIETVFLNLDWSYQDLNGLSTLLEGVNRIILFHYNNFTILSRCMRLYIKVVIQFRRLFNIKTGYSLFISSLFKVYYNLKCNISKQGIEYGIVMFFNLHRESFIFQMLGSLIPFILNNRDIDNDKTTLMSEALFNWLNCFNNNPINDPFKLKWNLPKSTNNNNNNINDNNSNSKLNIVNILNQHVKPVNNDGNINIFRPFPIISSLKLFITIIAYDPGSLRSEQFVTILQYLLPMFVRDIDSAGIIDLAIKSLITIFVKFSKGRTIFSKILSKDFNEEDNFNNTIYSNFGRNWQQNDRITIKLELFKLTSKLLDYGSELSKQNYEDLFYILKSIIKNNFLNIHFPIETFINTIIASTNDITLKFELSLDLLATVIGVTFNLNRPDKIASLINGVTTLAKTTASTHHVQSSSPFLLMLLKFLAFGRKTFLNLTLHDIKSCYILGNALVELLLVIAEKLPDNILNELNQFQFNIISLNFILIPFYLKYNQNNNEIRDSELIKKLRIEFIDNIIKVMMNTLNDKDNSINNGSEINLVFNSFKYLTCLIGIKSFILTCIKSDFISNLPKVINQLTLLIKTHIFYPILYPDTIPLDNDNNNLPHQIRYLGAIKISEFLYISLNNPFLNTLYEEINMIRNKPNNFISSPEFIISHRTLSNPPSISIPNSYNSSAQNLSLNDNSLARSPTTKTNRLVPFRFSRRLSLSKANNTTQELILNMPTISLSQVLNNLDYDRVNNLNNNMDVPKIKLNNNLSPLIEQPEEEEEANIKSNYNDYLNLDSSAYYVTMMDILFSELKDVQESFGFNS